MLSPLDELVTELKHDDPMRLGLKRGRFAARRLDDIDAMV